MTGGALVIALPEAFVRVTVDREGPAGSAWLSALPATLREMAERWECTPDGEPMYGGVGIVVPVLRERTGPAVLKVSFPHPENRFEPDALSAWGGRGAVLLHERDDDRFAMLLERAHPTTLAQSAQGDEVAAIAGSVSTRLAVPAPAGLPRLQDRAAGGKSNYARTHGTSPTPCRPGRCGPRRRRCASSRTTSRTPSSTAT
ncbi:aminoglycoside phosphotransferase family protein [Streptomyces erythrochromogenes]|uniref:aminoglycoside phosphotransferase family protein n=1 Tax=Streptomyces erythrochromogenes TaxID=285574 RepID=UPI00386FB568